MKKIVGICIKDEIKTDYYDLMNPVVRKQLSDMGFIAEVREKP